MSTAAPLLRERLGADAIDATNVYRYSAAGVLPACVLQPATIAEVVDAVGAARGAGLAVIPVGQGTHLDIGHPPRRYDAALSTHRLTRVIAHEAGDMTVTVEAGLTLAALARALKTAGQWLPFDPARADDMTVGGLIAADRSGPIRYGFGKVRDWLLGVKVVTADGAVVRGGGRVVKNVAGYDLPKLFAGSFGSLGVIVEATFKLVPLPADVALFIWPCATLSDTLAAVRSVLDSAVLPVLVEAVNEAAAESLGLEAGPCLVLGCMGSPAHLDEQERRVHALSDAAAWRVEADRNGPLRRALADFSQPANEDGIVARISALPTTLATLLPEIEAAAETRRTVAEIAAHAGNGVAWCQLLGAPSSDDLAELAGWLRATARARGAWVVYESVPAELRERIDPWGFAGPALALMTGVKRALDPTGMFSPGRFVGSV